MKPPFFLIEGLDISAYASVEALENQLEPFYVREVNYGAYDSEGRLLKLGVVVTRVPILFGLFKAEAERVVVQLAGNEIKHEDVLRDALIKNLSFTNKPLETAYNRMSLEELVLKFVDLNGLIT